MVVTLRREGQTPGDVKERVAAAIGDGIDVLLTEAGISAAAQVEVVDGDPSVTRGTIGVEIDGVTVWFNVEDVLLMAADAIGGHPSRAADATSWSADDPAGFASWCQEVVSVALRSSARLLLTDAVAEAMDVPRSALGGLRLALTAGHGIAGWRELTLGEDLLGDGAEIELAEAVISYGGRDRLIILVADDLLRDLLLESDEGLAGETMIGSSFAVLRNDLSTLLGFAPGIDIRPDHLLPPGTFRVTAGLRWSAARRGVPKGSVAIEPDGTDDWPSTSQHIRLPGTRGKDGVVVPRELVGTQTVNRPVWDPLDFVGLAALVDVRTVAAALVTQRVTVNVLAHAAWDRPLLEGLLRDEPGIARLTAALRHLVTAGLPLGDDATFEAALGGGSVTDLVDRMRAAVPFRVQQSASLNASVLPAYLLAPDLEDSLRRVGEDIVSEEVVIAAIAEKLGALEMGVARPAILTTSEHRAQLARLTTRRFPSLAVIAYDELPPETVIEPIDRIVAPDHP